MINVACAVAVRMSMCDNFGWCHAAAFPVALNGRQTNFCSIGRIHHTGLGDGGEWDKAYAYFDKVWGNVPGSLQKRFEAGPADWTAWLAQLKGMSAALAPAASR